MLTDQDIKNLTKYQLEVFKGAFMTKEDGSEMKDSLNTLQTTVDNIAKDVKVLKEEKLVNNHRLKATEDWIDQASPKLGVEFKH